MKRWAKYIRFRQRIGQLKVCSAGGFTITELAAALALIGIFLSFAFGSVNVYMRNAAFRKNQEIAQNLFAAAQLQLTCYEQQGRLLQLEKEVTDNGRSEKAAYLALSAAEAFSKGEEMLGEEGNGIWEGEPGDIYYLKSGAVHTTDDRLIKKYRQNQAAWCNEKQQKLWAYVYYTERLKGKTEEEIRELDRQGTETELSFADKKRLKVLFDLLDPCIADKESLMAAICIEFVPDPAAGMVYSVFYHHRAEEFVYGLVSKEEKKVSILDRSSEAKRQSLTGYYGVERLVRIGRIK